MILVMGMCIEVCYHPCMRVSGVSLNGFDVAAADLQLQRRAAVTQTITLDAGYNLQLVCVTEQQFDALHMAAHLYAR